jgi:lantibiotic transport system permease protein
MNVLIRAIRAESLKLKNTLALRLCIIAPLVVVVLLVLQGIFGHQPKVLPSPDQAWLKFVYACFGIWAVLMLPLFVTLESALIAGIEHNERQWKHLLALPVPRAVHFLAKWLSLLALVMLASLVFSAVLIPFGGMLLILFNVGGMAGAPPVSHIISLSIKVYLAAMLIMAIHTWIAIRWRSFTVAISVGMSATVIGFLVGQSERYGPYFPWTMPAQALAPKAPFDTVLMLSITGAVLCVIFASYSFTKREID